MPNRLRIIQADDSSQNGNILLGRDSHLIKQGRTQIDPIVVIKFENSIWQNVGPSWKEVLGNRQNLWRKAFPWNRYQGNLTTKARNSANKTVARKEGTENSTVKGSTVENELKFNKKPK